LIVEPETDLHADLEVPDFAVHSVVRRMLGIDR
jgi:hypothetical protein